MADLRTFNQTITNVKTQEYLESVLGKKKQSFVNNMTALVSNSKTLQECEPTSLLFAGLKATALDLPLDPNLGFSHVVPFRDKKSGTTLATFIIGWKGFHQLAIRSERFKHINVTDIREGELKSRNRLTGELNIEFMENDAIRMKSPIIGYAGYFELLHGYKRTLYMSVEELKQHGLKYSQTYQKGYGKWVEDFESMCRKTIYRLMLNKGDAPLSIEMQEALKYDQSAIIDEHGNNRYLDNEKPSAEDKLEAIAAKEQQMVEEVVAEEVEQANNGELFPGQ